LSVAVVVVVLVVVVTVVVAAPLRPPLPLRYLTLQVLPKRNLVLAVEMFKALFVLLLLLLLLLLLRRRRCVNPITDFSYPGALVDPKVPNKVLRYFEKVCVDKTVISFEYTDRMVSNW